MERMKFVCGHEADVHIELYWPESYLNIMRDRASQVWCPACRKFRCQPGGLTQEQAEAECLAHDQDCIVEDNRTGNRYPYTFAEAERDEDRVTVIWVRPGRGPLARQIAAERIAP